MTVHIHLHESSIYIPIILVTIDKSHNLCCGFGGLTWLSWVFFFNWYFFLISSFNIELIDNYTHDLFWFVFYEVILISWFESRIWRVNSVDSSFFFNFVNWCFFNFIFQHWVDYELDLIIYFCLFSMRLSRSYDLDHMFCKLTRVDWGCFIVSCF
jgi:hypothetical protein